MNPAEVLAPMTLRTPEDEPVLLGTLWDERPVVLAFIRHFG
jgi:hypothetical protein